MIFLIIPKNEENLIFLDEIISLVSDDNNSQPVEVIRNWSSYQDILDYILVYVVSHKELEMKIIIVYYKIMKYYPNRFVKDFNSVQEIERGGFGSVYKAINVIDLFEYAIKKVIIKSKSLSLNNFKKMYSEFLILATLNHSNVVRCHTAWIETETVQSQSNGTREEDSATKSTSSITDSAVVSRLRSGSTRDISYTNQSDSRNSLPSETSISTGDCSSKHSPSIASIRNGALEVFLGKSASVDHQLVLYIQMELCDDNLKNWLSTRNTSPGCLTAEDFDTVRCLARQLLTGIDYIHSNNVVHRDIKPANIFLVRHQLGSDRALQLKIGDFGLAKSLDYDSGPTSGKMSANVGTRFYTAPEVFHEAAKKTEYNHKCDLYSVGIVLLELMIKCTTVSELAYLIKEVHTTGRSDSLTGTWPLEAAHIGDLLSVDVTRRPNAGVILRDTIAFRECSVEVTNTIPAMTAHMDTENRDLRTTLATVTDENERLREEVRTGVVEDDAGTSEKFIQTGRLITLIKIKFPRVCVLQT